MKNRPLFLTRLLLLWVLLLFNGYAFAQSCNLTLQGQVLDQATAAPIEYASIYLSESGVGVAANDQGYFKITDICAGSYHLRISHIGCETQEIFVEIASDTILDLTLKHHEELLSEVTVHGDVLEPSTESSTTLGEETITQSANKNLADILAGITGVSTIKNGTGISKPVVHGLFGNRVAVLNNGIAQAGQQWGSDHAPEIDPFVADHLSIIKGAGALAYAGNSLGSVILVESDRIGNDPHLHGTLNGIFQSNGRGASINAKVEQAGPFASWRLTGTYKRQGDTKAPNYYLTNTGRKENNLALQVEKDFGENWNAQLYYSLFNTEIGLLRGSHVGNLTDLQSAISRDQPLMTESQFSYDINAPKQEVNHHLLKAEINHLISAEKTLRFTYGGQLNARKEFDVRRGGRSDRPALSLQQLTNYFETTYTVDLSRDRTFKTGIQLNYVDNENQLGTGVLPLIPDYKSMQSSAFVVFQKRVDEILFEAAVRGDYRDLLVWSIIQGAPPTIERKDQEFFNYSASAGLAWKPGRNLNSQLNVAFKQRAPEVNELYSFGLHQGVSGIEEGNLNLDEETAFKVVLTQDMYLDERFFVQVGAYFQSIDNYIYLQPQREFRLTISGAFPYYKYEQTNAQIYGLDLLAKYESGIGLEYLFKYSYLRGQDISNDLPLIYMPANNLTASATWTGQSAGEKSNQRFVTVTGNYVAQQKRLEASQDFLAAPEAYFLLGLKAGTGIKFRESEIKFTLTVENLLDESYRDYLNRLRYFADEAGINVSLGIGFKF